jgi:hypothetical protein
MMIRTSTLTEGGDMSGKSNIIVGDRSFAAGLPPLGQLIG